MTLLDTHVLIWLMEGQARLGKRARRFTDTELARDELGVSAISFWEVAMLHQRNRIRLAQPPDSWRQSVLELGIQELPVSGEVGIAAAMLTDFHPDPADRIIVATATLQRARLLTADGKILDWSGSLLRHDARK